MIRWLWKNHRMGCSSWPQRSAHVCCQTSRRFRKQEQLIFHILIITQAVMILMWDILQLQQTTFGKPSILISGEVH